LHGQIHKFTEHVLFRCHGLHTCIFFTWRFNYFSHFNVSFWNLASLSLILFGKSPCRLLFPFIPPCKFRHLPLFPFVVFVFFLCFQPSPSFVTFIPFISGTFSRYLVLRHHCSSHIPVPRCLSSLLFCIYFRPIFIYSDVCPPSFPFGLCLSHLASSFNYLSPFIR